MIIFQKNFNNNVTAVPTSFYPPWYSYMDLPGAGNSQPASSNSSYAPARLGQSSVNPNYDFRTGAVGMDPSSGVEAAARNAQYNLDEARVRSNAIQYAQNQAAQLTAPTTVPTPTVNENVDIIDTTLEEEALPASPATTTAAATAGNSNPNPTGTVGDASTAATAEGATKFDGIKSKLSQIKNKAGETWTNWSNNYGEGITGSLATDAALAAGGLALAGGAYNLLKKRRERKRAEKEALNNRVRK